MRALIAFYLINHVISDSKIARQLNEVCQTNEWTYLNFESSEDLDNYTRLTSDKCAVSMKNLPDRYLSKKIMNLLSKKKLKMLQITNGLNGMDEDAFAGFKNLISLDLTNDDLYHSKVRLIAGTFFKTLETLNLSNNSLVTIEMIGNEFKQLKEIDISDNLFTEVPLSQLTVFPNLKEINISFNRIKNFSENNFVFADLKYLDASNNLLENLDGLEFLPNLRVLNLGQNQLKDLNGDYFDSFHYDLRELYLNQNHIEVLSLETLVNLQFLKIFSIEKNAIRKLITTTLSEELIDLEYMNLGKNYLDDIPHNFFKWFPKLIHLKLNHNKLSYIRPKTFANLNKLESLDLSHNQITDFDDRRLIALEKLTYFDISDNDIQYVDYISLVSHVPSLKVVNFSKNKLRCDNLRELITFLRSNNIQVDKTGKCEIHENVEGLCCNDVSKNSSGRFERKIELVSMLLMKRSDENLQHIDRFVKFVDNSTNELKLKLKSMYDREEEVYITKLTFWAGVLLLTIIILSSVLLIIYFMKKWSKSYIVDV